MASGLFGWYGKRVAARPPGRSGGDGPVRGVAGQPRRAWTAASSRLP